ncbi:MAG: hypothetical protein ACMUEL_06760 [Flavobacteriales bacterium Tduv]
MLRSTAQLSFSELYMEQYYCVNGGLRLFSLLDGIIRKNVNLFFIL